MQANHTIEAIASADKSQWKVGDAIKRDLKEEHPDIFKEISKLSNFDSFPKPPRGFFTERAERAKALGFDQYNASELGKLYHTACAFGPGDRLEYAWSAHFEAGTPANLKKAATALKKIGKKVTGPDIHHLVGVWADEEAAKRDKKSTKAKDTKKQAETELAKTSEQKLAAKNEAEREAAEQRRQQLLQEIEDADEAIKANGKVTPRTDFNVDEADPSALEEWAIYLGVVAHTGIMQREGEKALKDLAKLADRLSPEKMKRLADGFNEIIEIANKLNQMVGEPEHEQQKKTASHLRLA